MVVSAAVLLVSRTMSAVDEHSRVLMRSAEEAVGNCSRSRAIRPVTRGAAKLVPDLVVVPLGGAWPTGGGEWGRAGVDCDVGV